MYGYKLAFLLVSAFMIAYFSMPMVMVLAHKIGAIDQPDARKVHRAPMPRLGGMAIFMAFLIPSLFLIFSVQASTTYLGIIIGSVIVFAVGMLDDVYQLSPGIKLIGQSIAALTAMYFGVMVQFVTHPFDGMVGLGILAIPLTFLWIVGITNAINLIDGLDGLAAGVSGIAALTMGIVAYIQGQQMVFVLALLLMAAIAGFLPYNFYPARTFMGDGGSNFLGFILACLAIMGLTKSTAIISLFVPIVILGIPIFDTFFAIIRRFINKKPIFRPDKAHLHHRLMALGFTHRRSVLIIYGISAFFGSSAIILSILNNPRATLLLGLLLILVVIGAEKIGICTEKRSSSQPRTQDS
jgi:UDP-GlcNAc:undecaprenyl-phosphate GlcNAc-1-phosphate transferase